MTEKKPPQWKEVQRKPLGLYMSVDGRYAYASVTYEITERSLEDSIKYRTRTQDGECVYVHEHPELWEIFHMTALGYKRLMNEGLALDNKHLTSSQD